MDDSQDLQDQQDQLRQYLMSKYGQDLGAAQQVTANDQFTDDMGRAAQRMGAAIAGSPAGVDDAYFKQQAAQNQLPVQIAQEQGNAAKTAFQVGRQSQQDQIAQNTEGRAQDEFKFKQGQEARTTAQQKAEDDPTSNVSKTYQALMNKFNPGTDYSGMSATDIKSAVDPAEKLHAADERAKELGEQIKSRQMYQEALLGNKMQGQVDKAAQALQNDIDPNKQRAGNFAQAAQRVQKAGALETMVNQYQDHNLPPSKIHELAIGLASMLSGGNAPASETIKSLVPSSALGDASKLEGWLANEPYGTNQAAFVNDMLNTVQREKQYWGNQVGQMQAQRLGSHGWLKQHAPDVYNSIRNQYGVGDDNIDAKGNYAPGWQQQATGAGAGGIPLANAPGLPSSGMVKIQAPDGSVASVPAARADYYVKKGGKLLGQ